MTKHKEYTTIVSPDDKKKHGVCFKIFSGIATTITLSFGGYTLFNSNKDNSHQGLSMTIKKNLEQQMINMILPAS